MKELNAGFSLVCWRRFKMTSLRRRIVAVKWPKASEIILLCNPFESSNCVEVHFLFWKNAIFSWIVSVVISDARQKRTWRAKTWGKAIKPHWAGKKKKKPNTSSFVFLWIWFNKTGLPSWSTTDLQTPNIDGTLAWERLSLDSCTEGKRDFLCMTTFSLQRPAASQSNRKLYRMVCTPSGAFQCLGDSFKTA